MTVTRLRWGRRWRGGGRQSRRGRRRKSWCGGKVISPSQPGAGLELELDEIIAIEFFELDDELMPALRQLKRV